MSKKIIVIGSGFSSLSAATYLSKYGYQVTILEKNKSFGGRARKFNADGFIVKPNTNHYHPRSYFKEKGINFKYFSPNNNHYQQIVSYPG